MPDKIISFQSLPELLLYAKQHGLDPHYFPISEDTWCLVVKED